MTEDERKKLMYDKRKLLKGKVSRQLIGSSVLINKYVLWRLIDEALER